MPSTPPGYLGFNSPPVLSVRQKGVMRLAPAASASAAACAAIHEKIPVVMGQAKSVLCFLASALRSSLIVTTRPLGTCFISASTSRGAGMTNVPVPQRLVILPVTLQTFGRPSSSASFSRQDFFVFICREGWRVAVPNIQGRRHGDPPKSKMRHDLDFHIRAFGQRGDLNCRTRWKIAREMFRVNFVHPGEVGE